MPFNVVVGGFQNNNIWTYNKNLQMRGLQSSYKCEIPKQKKNTHKKTHLNANVNCNADMKMRQGEQIARPSPSSMNS